MAQVVDGVRTAYVLDVATPLTMVLGETTDPGGPEEASLYYLHGLDLAAQGDGTTTEYFAYDGLGSVRQVLSDAGSPLLTQAFDPYGNAYASVGTSTSAFGFTGEQTDANGLLYLRARYYAPEMGRFFQQDSWPGNPFYPQSMNPYLYGLGNPVLYTDPSGNCVFGIDTALCVAVGVTAVIGAGVGYGMYRLALSGRCGCELQQWAQSKTPGQVALHVAKIAGIAAVAAPISLAIPDEVLVAAGAAGVFAGTLGAGVAFQKIEQDSTNWCAWTEFILLTLPLALKTAGYLRGTQVSDTPADDVAISSVAGSEQFPGPGTLRAGSYRGQPPSGRSGIYEFYDSTRGGWYVGKSVDLRTRLNQHLRDGRFASWDDVIWTEIPVRSSPGGQVALRAAEQARIEQLIVLEGDKNVVVLGPQMNSTALEHFFAQGEHLKLPGWPEWLRLPDN